MTSNTDAKFEIAKADPTCTAPTAAATYGQKLRDITPLTNPTGNTPGTWTWADNTQDVGNVGTNTFKATFKPNDTSAYNVKDNVEVSVTVSAKTVTNPTFDGLAASFEYTGSEIKPEFTLKDGDNTIPATEYTIGYSNNTNKGTATITITDVVGGNYTVSGSATFEISARVASIVINDPATITYDGAAVTAGTTGSDLTYTYGGDGDVTIKWYADNNGSKGSGLSDAPTNAGTYWVGVSAAAGTNYGAVSEVLKQFTISPKTLTSAMIKLDSTQKTYDGSEKSATFTVEDGANSLTLDTDYTITSGGTAINVEGKTLKITGKGNYDGEATASTTWSLQKATLTASHFTFTAPTNLTYDGNSKTAAVALNTSYSGAGLITVKYEKDSSPVTETKDAGKYTVKIDVGDGTNFNAISSFTDAAWKFTVNPADQAAPTGLGVAAPTTSSGNGRITGTTTAMEYSTDGSFASPAGTDCSNTETEVAPGIYYVRFKADNNHNAGTAATVTVPAYSAAKFTVTVTSGDNGTAIADNTSDITAGETVTLTATPNRGYEFEKWGDKTPTDLSIGSDNKFTMPSNNVKVKAYFKPAALDGTVNITGTLKYGETLTADITGITNNTGTLTYEWYRGSYEITDATGDTYTLVEADIGKAITVKVSSSVQTDEISSAATSTIEKADGPEAPSAFTLGFTLNADGETYTATIPAVTDGEYSFDGTNYSATNTKDGCAANTSYTGYVRIKETTTYKAGAAASDTQTAPKLTVATPTFTPNGASSFTGTQSVTIYCTTTDATIYYTTDGTTPTAASTKYTDTISLTATTTVKAIAVKTGMNDSAVTTATFTKYSGGSSSGGGSSYNPTYAVSVDKTENGSVSVSPKNATKGTTVTVTTTPDKGWTLETLTVLDKDGKELDFDIVTLGEKYTFKMPSGKVTVKATFMEDNTMLNYFVDVSARDYFYDAVLWAVERGITDGTDELHFSPNAPCTRAQIVTFLWRAAGSPEPKSEGSFSDVKAGSYYAKAVAWAVENGITGGTGDGKFSPDATCTRAQAVTFLARALNARAEGKTEFSDVPANAYYADAVAWAAENGVTTGIGGGLFDPNGSCTRAQIVVFLYRAYLGK